MRETALLCSLFLSLKELENSTMKPPPKQPISVPRHFLYHFLLPNMKKHLSSIANRLLQSCAQEMGTSVDEIVCEFEAGLKGEESDYNKKLVEFCASKALQRVLYEGLEEKIGDGSLSRFTFDMILAWESPSPVDEELKSECVAKEREDLNPSVKNLAVEDQDDVPLFYSDLVPLMQVDDQQSIGEDAFVWLATLFPFVADVVNSRFTFEALTASTLNRLYYPAYDLFIKGIYKQVKYIQQQVSQTGVELRDDEVVLHFDGTGNTQRVIRHKGGASWPGRLILTNYALYFEASGVITYEKAIKIDLSKQDVDHNVSPAPTGPWGAPLFDKGMVYESSQLSESLVLEFPEVASSIRRDYWLTLVKEVILLHNFLSSFNNESVVEKWEMHCRTILGIYRLHAVREMLRVSPPAPSSFLIFSLYDELPKGDYVLQELAINLKQISSGHPFTATWVLESLNIKHPSIHDFKHREGYEETGVDYVERTSLETTINQVKQEAEETYIAKSSAAKLKEEGLSNSVLILLELLSPYKSVLTSTSEVAKWERPAVTLLAMFLTFIIMYKEWIGYSISVTLLYGAVKMLRLRHKGVDHKCAKVVVDALSDPTAMETIVTAQHGMLKLQEMVQRTNISIMKLYSLLTWTAPKVILGLLGAAALFILIPIKFILMAITCYCFMMSFNLDKCPTSDRSNRRLREWWDSIPVCPVQIGCANP